MQSEQQIKIVGGSTFGRYPKISGRKVYNLFESDGWLIDFPGWKKVASLTTGAEGRGSFVSERGNIGVCVTDNVVWNVSPQIGVTFVGTIETSSGSVFMDENLNGQICIVDQSRTMYIYNRNTNALINQKANIPDWLVPNYVCFHDTYFLIGNGDSTGNGARWAAFSFLDDNNITLTYELAFQTKPDYARAIVRLSQKGGNVLVFGKAVVEIQNNVGGLIGYQRLLTINIDYGTISVATIASIDNFVAWLAVNEKTPPVIMYFDGQQQKTISTDGINHFLDSLNRPDKSFGFFYTKDGHFFYQLTFYDQEDDVSIAYDFKQDAFYFVTDKNLNSHPARGVWFINNNSYFLNYKNGAIYQFRTEYPFYDENIGPTTSLENVYMMPRQVVGDTFRVQGMPDPFSVNFFYLLMEQGAEPTYTKTYVDQLVNNYILAENGDYLITEDGQQIIADGSGYDPSGTYPSPFVNYYAPGVDFSFSMDGSTTFSNEVRRTMNFSGYRKNIMQWEQLGWMNEFTPKIKIWSYGRAIINNATIVIEQ